MAFISRKGRIFLKAPLLFSYLALVFTGHFFFLPPSLAQEKHTPKEPSSLKIATWNLEWLTDKHEGHTLLPLGVKAKSVEDLRALIAMRSHLDADIIAFQEADDTPMLDKLFPPELYTVFLSAEKQPIVQHTGIALRKPLQATRHNDVNLQIGPTTHSHHPVRNGVDITLFWHNKSVRLLAVHLKSGCWDALLLSKTHSCPSLRFQLSQLHDWIGQRLSAQEDFIILGDFNRRLILHDQAFQDLAPAESLTLTTNGKASPCNGGHYFIDHIILSHGLKDFFKPDSLRVALYPSAGHKTNGEDNLNVPSPPSDHCPVSIRLAPFKRK